MIRYPLKPPETLAEAVIHASMMASADPDHSYEIVCQYCDKRLGCCGPACRNYGFIESVSWAVRSSTGEGR